MEQNGAGAGVLPVGEVVNTGENVPMTYQKDGISYLFMPGFSGKRRNPGMNWRIIFCRHGAACSLYPRILYHALLRSDSQARHAAPYLLSITFIMGH